MPKSGRALGISFCPPSEFSAIVPTYLGTSSDGGGIFVQNTIPSTTSKVDIRNSTISGNSVSDRGGGLLVTDNQFISAASILTLTNTTLSANAAMAGGSAIFGEHPCAIHLRNTIADAFPGSVCGGDADYSGNGALVRDFSCPIGSTGNLLGTDPLLGALASNGGTTKTHKPSTMSPAIDAGNDALCPADDQRLAPRECCWIGSYEDQSLCP